MLKIGKLYKVNDYALSDEAEFGLENQFTVRDHGYLWMWEGKTNPATEGDAGSIGYYCRSLATGETRTFFPEELETSE